MAYLIPFLLLSSFVAIARSQDPKDLACENRIPAEPLCMFVTPLTFPPTIDATTGKSLHIGAYKIYQVRPTTRIGGVR